MVATHMLCAALEISTCVVTSNGRTLRVVVVVVVVVDDDDDDDDDDDEEESRDCVGGLTPNPATDGRRKETKQKDDTREYIVIEQVMQQVDSEKAFSEQFALFFRVFVHECGVEEREHSRESGEKEVQ